jgi:putative aldouronate transport system substrate-binding protein
MRSRVAGVAVAVLLLLGATTGFASGGNEAAAPAGQEAVPVKILMPGGPQPPDANMVFDAAKKYAGSKIGAYPVIEFVPWDNWPNRKRLLLQAGEELDIVFTASWSDFASEVARNAWIPLEGLIDKYAPDIRKIVGIFLDGATVSGHIYAVPTVKEQAEGTQFILNKELVDKYSVPVAKIKSLQDLEPWLQKIKDNEPGVVPYLLDGVSTPSETFRYGWDAVGNGRRYYLDHKEYASEDGKVHYAYFIDSVWQTLQTTRSWYQKGFFQKEVEDVGTDLAAQSQKYLASGKYFAWSHVSHPGKVPEQSTAWGHPLIGSGPVWRQMVTKNILNGSMDAIAQTSKKSMQAIKLLELMNKDQFFNNLLNFGIEGRHYQFADKASGVIVPLKPANAGEGYAPNMQWALQNQFLTYLTKGEAADKWEQYKKYNADAGVWPTVGFIEDVTAVNTQVAGVDAVTTQYEGTLLRGLVDPASIKQEFQNALASAGVHDVEAALQKQIDAFLATRKK